MTANQSRLSNHGKGQHSTSQRYCRIALSIDNAVNQKYTIKYSLSFQKWLATG
jgi:hypothetical protein